MTMSSAAPLLSVGVQTVFHPLVYAKTLIQIGYEPIDPINSRSLFGSSVLIYPNIFKYVKYIRKQDGFFGMYRGLGPRLTAGILSSIVQTKLMAKFKKNQSSNRREEIDGDDEEDEEDGIMKLIKDLGIDMLCRTSAVIVSYPFQVIMVRSMAQFVGRETIYSNSFSAIVEIYNKDGIQGFFAGLIPRLFGEILSIWLTGGLTYIVTNYVLQKDNKDLHRYAKGFCSLIITHLSYPLNLVSTVMCVNGSELAAGRAPLTPIYSGWTDCWSQLRQQNQLKRGSTVFWRYFTGPTIMKYDGKIVPAEPLFIN